jgi:hypothetical protein
LPKIRSFRLEDLAAGFTAICSERIQRTENHCISCLPHALQLFGILGTAFGTDEFSYYMPAVAANVGVAGYLAVAGGASNQIRHCQFPLSLSRFSDRQRAFYARGHEISIAVDAILSNESKEPILLNLKCALCPDELSAAFIFR